MAYSEMGFLKLPLVVLLCSVFSLLSFIALCDASELTVKFLKTPQAFSNLTSTTFVFEVLVGGSGACTNSNITCKLDDGFGRINASECENGTVLCEGLQDGNHKFEVCPNGSQGVGCSSYNWTVDTVPPTAYISTSTPFTNALNVSINISFSEPCTGGGFVCSPAKCNLLVSGAGQVIPTSLKTIQRNLQYSVLVGLSSTAQSGRVTLVMDKNFCTDSAGNKFTRNANSILNVHLNRLSVNLTTHVPKRQLQFNGETRVVRATNNCNNLRICITFPVPVRNSSEQIKNALKAEILYSLQMNPGRLLPLVVTEHQGPRRFEFMIRGFSQSNFTFSEVGSKVAACIPDMAVVNVSVDTDSIISRQGTRVSPVETFTFLYASPRPDVMLSTLPSESPRSAVMLRTPCHICTRERNIRVLIKFGKPVFGFGRSNISITAGGDLKSFEEIRNGIYIVEIKAKQDIVSVSVPENVTGDVAGNKNQPSNVLLVRHYSVPKISLAFYGSTTVSFVVIFIAAGLLTVSMAKLHSTGAFSSPSPSLSQPHSNLFRIACYLQVIALSGWLAVRLPVEYYELTRGLRWSIPCLSLPWERETGRTRLVMENSSLPANTHMSKIHHSGNSQGKQPKPGSITGPAASLVAKDLELFEPLQNALHPSILHGWSGFGKNMFWLAIIGGGFINVHALLLLILNLKKKNSEEQRDYGVFTFPRFEIVIVNLALTSICQASVALIRGGKALEIAVGVLLLGVVSFLLLAWLLFLYKGITFGNLLQYEEVHQEARGLHWYQKIGRVFLVSVERGEWTPKYQYLTILGSLYGEVRGPPQISGGSSHTQEPFIQKLFGKLRIYYTLLESVIQKLCGELRIYYPLLLSVKRVLLAIVAGVYEDNSSSKIPTIISLCINCFQLFFLVLEKPYIDKGIQLLEIISVSSEACIFAISFKELSDKDETIFGVLMLILFLVGLLPQMMYELWDLYEQIKQLDSPENRFLTGLKIALFGLAQLFISPEFLSSCFPHLKDIIANSNSQPTSAAEKDTATPHLKDNIADSNSKSTSVADEDTATSTSISYQVKSPNQD